MKNTCSVLIISCDKYADLWEPFFRVFWQRWSDCPYRVYLGSNTISYKKDQRVKTLLSGADSNWSMSLNNILRQIPSETLLVMMDDIFLKSPIKTEQIERCINFMHVSKAKHIHACPKPRPDRQMKDPFFGVYEKGMPYRINAAGFWRKSYLEELLIDGENPWNFEIFGSYRSSYQDGFYCTMEPLFTGIHMVEKGMWISSGLDYCRKNGIDCKLGARKQNVTAGTFYKKLQAWYFDTIIRISWKKRVALMNVLRKALVSY